MSEELPEELKEILEKESDLVAAVDLYSGKKRKEIEERLKEIRKMKFKYLIEHKDDPKMKERIEKAREKARKDMESKAEKGELEREYQLLVDEGVAKEAYRQVEEIEKEIKKLKKEEMKKLPGIPKSAEERRKMSGREAREKERKKKKRKHR